MYNEFYDFKEYPFRLTPDPDFFYLSPIHKKALSYLVYGLKTKQGFIQLTGEVGSGKTTVVRSLIKDIHKEAKISYIVNPKLPFIQLLRTILSQFSIIKSSSKASKDIMLEKFHQYLTNQSEQKCPVVIIFDEAQDLEPTVLEEIRLLSNLETEKEKLLQIIFVGEPELRSIFSLPKLKQLKQRVSTEVHIDPLSRTEMENYINHRMNIAGANGSVVFEKKACDAIYRYSKGIPRLINIACNATLLAGYVQEKKVFNGALAKEVISDLTPNEITGSKLVTPTIDTDTSTTLKTSKPWWVVALLISLLIASIAGGLAITIWYAHNSLKPLQDSSVIEKNEAVMLDPKSDINQLDEKDGT